MNRFKQKPMKHVWQSLLWKEWHEHKWKLAALMAIAMLGPTIPSLLGDDLEYRKWVEAVGHSTIPLSILAGLFVGMGTAASENHRGTMRFLRTLPISMRRPALVKLGRSMAIVTLPVMLMILSTYATYSPENEKAHIRYDELVEVVLKRTWDGMSPEEQAELRQLEITFRSWTYYSDMGLPFNSGHTTDHLPVWIIDTTTHAVLFVVSLLLWMAACGVGHSDEVRAGAVGFLIMLLVWGSLVGLLEFADSHHLDWLSKGLAIPQSVAPGAIAFLRPIARDCDVPLALLVTSSVIGHVCLAYWYLSRFGKKSGSPQKFGEVSLFGRSRLEPKASTYLRPPIRSPLRAIAWKQFWETGPLALTAVVATVGIATLVYPVQNRDFPSHNHFAELLGGVTFGVGFLVTVVAGIGVFLDDMKPQIGTFWRSRPIKLPVWFGVKFFTGLLVLTVTFGSLLLLSYWLLDSHHRIAQNLEHKYFWIVATSAVLIFMLIYTLAMACYCVTRHPVIAAMTTILLFFAGMYGSAWISREFLSGDAYPGLGLVTLSLTQVVVLAICWLIVRNNWN